MHRFLIFNIFRVLKMEVEDSSTSISSTEFNSIRLPIFITFFIEVMHYGNAISSLISVQSSRNIDIRSVLFIATLFIARKGFAIKPNTGKRAMKKFYAKYLMRKRPSYFTRNGAKSQC